MNMIYLLILVSLLQYFYFALQVGRARGVYDIQAPATTGNEIFERVYRVQVNTQEQLLIFIPSLYLFAVFLSPLVGQILAIAFIVFRFVYARSYVNEPSSRSLGFIVSGSANLILLIGAIIGVMIDIFTS